MTSAEPACAGQMLAAEYRRLRELLAELEPRTTLEIGLAEGGSARYCCDAVASSGGTHTAVDPCQTSVFGRQGVSTVERAGHAERFELIEEPSHVALPRLLAEQRRFDFILVDGWHSFDYVLVDFFYSDMLLRVGGVVAFHDVGWPSIYRVCKFIESHKPYERISPEVYVERRSLAARAGRRLWQVLRGAAVVRDAAERRKSWIGLAAYRKTADHVTPTTFCRRF